MDYIYSYQIHGNKIEKITICADTQKDADWKLLRHFEIQYNAIFSVSVIRNFIEKIHVSIYGDICISFKDSNNKEFFCTIYNQKNR